MVGPTSQIAAITCFLNARIQGFRTNRFFPDNSTCKFCEFIHFVELKRNWFGGGDKWKIVAHGPDEWYDQKIIQKPSRALLMYGSTHQNKFPDRMTAGFVGGGGEWRIALQIMNKTEYWVSRWKVGDQKAKDQRIWQVEYGKVAEETTTEYQPLSIDDLTCELNDALTAIGDFAIQHGINNFAQCFAKAQQCLVSSNPFSLVYHQDLMPEGVMTLKGAQLLAAAQASWVFGGMGSWNDMGFDGDDQKRYDEVSNRLFNLLNPCICTAVNQTAPFNI